MKARTLLVLGVAAAVAVAGAVIAVRDQGADRSDLLVRERIFPDLLSDVDRIAALTVTRAGESFVMEPVDGVWALPSKGGYPVRPDLVRRAVIGLGEAETVEAKTADPARYGRLGVGDPTTPEGGGILLSLADAEGRELAALVLGDAPEALRGMRYVRVPDEARSWLARIELEAGGRPIDWIDQTVLEVDRGRINRVVITHPDGETVTVAPREGEQGFRLVELPEGRSLRTPYTLGGIISALMTVRIEDVAPVSTVDFGADPVVARYETRDGTIVTVTTVERDDESIWGRFSVGYDAALAVPEEAQEGRVNDPAADPDAEPAERDHAAEAEAMEAELSPWAYRLPTHINEQFRKRVGDLLLQEVPEGVPPAGGTERDQMDEIEQMLRSRMPGAGEAP